MRGLGCHAARASSMLILGPDFAAAAAAVPDWGEPEVPPADLCPAGLGVLGAAAAAGDPEPPMLPFIITGDALLMKAAGGAGAAGADAEGVRGPSAAAVVSGFTTWGATVSLPAYINARKQS
jgi:hypothetical protein